MSESEDPRPGSMFWIYARNAVDTIRRAKMNDSQIAMVLCNVRAAAIHEEGLRLKLLLDNNPPQAGVRWPSMENEIQTHCEAQSND